MLQKAIPVVECATLHGEEFQKHKEQLDKYARRYKASAVAGAGWEPGALSIFRGIFALLTPKGHSEISHHPGIDLHHTTLAAAIPGVKQALSIELHASNKKSQRYVYVELEDEAELDAVERAIQTDPLFINEETLVFAVEDIKTLEEEGHGVLLERHGTAGSIGHQLLLLEARFSERALAAQIMLSAARTLSTRGHRAYSLFDLPLGSLWGDLRDWAEQQWI